MDGDLISRKALLEAIDERERIVRKHVPDIQDDELRPTLKSIREFVRNRPAVDAEPVKYGRIVEDWKDRKKGTIKRVFTCCDADFTDLTQWMRPRYCPDCGAKIEGETERKWLSQES